MYDILLETIEELKDKRRDLVESYEKFKKDFQKYHEDLEKSGYDYGYVTKESIFGTPYKKIKKML